MIINLTEIETTREKAEMELEGQSYTNSARESISSDLPALMDWAMRAKLLMQAAIGHNEQHPHPECGCETYEVMQQLLSELEVTK